MGHHARTLTALLVAATSTLALTQAASANVVRVELPSRTVLPRTVVTPLAGADVTSDGQTVVASCAADSPIAALAAANVPFRGTVDPQGHVVLSQIGDVAVPAPGASADWSWAAFAGKVVVADPCTDHVYNGTEVLFLPHCGAKTQSCFTQGPLYLQVRQSDVYGLDVTPVPGYGAPVETHVAQAFFDGTSKPTLTATVSTDEGVSAGTNDDHHEGIASISFTNPGQHTIWAKQPGAVTMSAQVCATDGGDGFCGSTKTVPPPNYVYPPSPCATTGKDGFCGSPDTSGPIAHVTNIAAKQVFKTKKGPGQVKGTLEVDPNGVGKVSLRLTRVTTARVKVKAKKVKKGKKKPKTRYKTVKRCTAWNEKTALLAAAKCGTKNAKWFQADLSDLRNEFTYSFALTLPAGTYTLEVQATDENGFKDVPTAGRNVLVFTVK
jgi:hypothetical protein